MSTLKTIAVLGCILALQTPVCLPGQQPLSRKELHRLLASATSPEDCAKLELYYRDQAVRYEFLAKQQKEEMRRSQNAAPWEKVPHRSESAKQLWEYYQGIAARDKELAAKYAQGPQQR